MTEPQSFETKEKHLSQVPALQVLMNLGYDYLTPAEALKARKGKQSNVILEDILRQQLKAINTIEKRGKEYEFTDENIEKAIQALKDIPYDGLVRTSEKVYDLITLLKSLEQNIDGSKKSFSIQYIDWERPERNVYHVTAEFSIERTRSVKTRRPDIVLFVNGIPLGVIECKPPTGEVDEAIGQNIRNQSEDNIPKFYTYIQIAMGINKNKAFYGTTGTAAKFWGTWQEESPDHEAISRLINQPLSAQQKDQLFSAPFHKEERRYFDGIEQEGAREITEQDRLLCSLCPPSRFLELARKFIVYEGVEKKIARYQQYFAVQETLSRIKQFDSDGKRLGGVIHHTQGSGKSLTMVMLAKCIALDTDIPEPRIILVTDRKDLDKQIVATFKTCGLETIRAKTGKHLLELIQSDKAAVITSVINKFASAVNARSMQNDSANFFVLVDESHRTQYGSLHPNMKYIFPKASYLGFTGTPLTKTEKNTFTKFGGLIHKYTIDQAVKDKAVVPLLYEGRHVEQEVNQKAIDLWFERVCAGLTPEQKKDLKKKYSSAGMLNKTEQKIHCTAFDISEHYRQNWQGTGFKAQLVAPGKPQALLYKKYLDEIGYVTSEVIISGPYDLGEYDTVDAEPDDEVLKFWNRMMIKYGDEDAYLDQVIDRFKHSDEPEILIVVSKLLTGFDAPKNAVLYVAKPLKEHTLLQAIARVNRLYENKEYGYIIDYANILGELDKALTSYRELEGFEEEDLVGALTNVKEEVEKVPQKHSELWDIFREIKNKSDEEAFEQFLADEKIRQDFYEALSAYAKALAIALSTEKFILETDPTKIKTYKNDLKRFQNLRAAVKQRYAEVINYKDYEPKIKKLLDTHISSNEVTQLTEPINIFEIERFEEEVAKLGKISSKADTIAFRTRRTITERLDEDPAFFKRFSQLLEEAIQAFRQQRISDLEYLNRVRNIQGAIVNREDTDIPQALKANDNAKAYYGIMKVALDAKEISSTELQTTVTALALQIDAIICQKAIVNWINNPDIQKEMKNEIEDCLFDLEDTLHIQFGSSQIDDMMEQCLRVAYKKLQR